MQRVLFWALRIPAEKALVFPYTAKRSTEPDSHHGQTCGQAGRCSRKGAAGAGTSGSGRGAVGTE